MEYYRPARFYFPAASFAAASAAFSAWRGAEWAWAYVPAAVFAAAALALGYLAARPTIGVAERELRAGARRIAWSEIAGVESGGWPTPRVFSLTLRDGRLCRIVYPGEPADADRLDRRIRYFVLYASLEDEPSARVASAARPPRPRFLRREDEAEVERLYREMKSARNADSGASSSEDRQT